jgi:uncharacterized protein (DUF58 family)
VSRNRIVVVATLVIAFVVLGAILIFANQPHVGQKVTVNLTVTGANSMSPVNSTVRQNDIVTINVASDTTGEVHLHGYDKQFFCIKGQVVSQTFTANNTGTFEIEWEATSTHLGYLVVTP